MTDRCDTCGEHPATRNNAVRECSHVDCPHRRRATAWGSDMHGDTEPASLVCMNCLRAGHYAADCPRAPQALERRRGGR